MLRRPPLSWRLTLTLAACVVAHAAAAQSAPVPLSVDEAHASAALGAHGLEVRLPLNRAADAGATTSVWLLSPKDEASSKSTQTLEAGAGQIQTTLPMPRDSRWQAVKAIGWYRIAYEVTAAGQTSHGILSVGAVTRNLLALTMARPARELEPGKPLFLRVFAGNAVTRNPLRGVQMRATLDIDAPGHAAQKVTRSAVSNSSGEAEFQFPIPDVSGVSASLKVEATLRGQGEEVATSELESDFDAQNRGSIHVEKDKPLYQPGQTVHLRALLFDAHNRAMANASVTLTVTDPEYKKVLAAPLTTNRFGIASYDWKLSDQVETGRYDVSFKSGDENLDAEAEESISVERYDLPEFTVSAVLDRGYYLDGQTPELKIRANYLFGRPVSGASIRLVRQDDNWWDTNAKKPITRHHPDERGTLDSQGTAVFHPDLKEDFAAFQSSSYERYRDLEFRAYVTDPTTGRTEPRKFKLRISHDPIHLYLQWLSGDNREGDYLAITSYADGIPASVKVTVDAVTASSTYLPMATVQTNRYGLGKVHLRYPAPINPDDRLNLRIHATDAHGLASTLDDSLYSGGTEDSPSITVDKSLLAPKEPIQAIVHGPNGKIVDVDVYAEDTIVRREQVTLRNGSASLLLQPDQRFHGIVTIAAYSISDPHPSSYGRTTLKCVLYPEDTALRLQLTGLKKSYQPGEEVQASFHLSNATAGVPGALGIAVTDAAVDERARTEEDFDERSYGWYSWYGRPQVSGLTLDDLNRLDMSGPVPEGMDLAAEAILNTVSGFDMKVESDDDWEDRQQYESLMRQRLLPLGRAILDATPERLPAAVDEIAAVAKAKFSPDHLLEDPWDTPYRAQRETTDGTDVLSLLSAGPDKKWGTSDDFDFNIARQSVFAHAGERLNAMLTAAVDRGEALPGSTEQLLHFALDRGLDLASLRDPDGHPFVYRVSLFSDWLSVSASLENRKNDQGEVYAMPALWSSTRVEYFKAAAQRLQAAITAWIAAGHPFPSTQEEALRAFTAAGIDFAGLRDPMGQPYTVQANDTFLYTQTQHVIAGERVSVTATPATHRVHAIQIRHVVQREKDLAPEETVARFVQPYQEQTGKDLQPQSMDDGVFHGNTGGMGGTVVDPTGAVIPNAVVVLKDQATGEERDLNTDQEGRFLSGDLQPDLYSIEVSSPGFTSYGLIDIRVSSASLTTVDVTLKPAATDTRVTVVAEMAPMLHTENATMSAELSPGAVLALKLKSLGDSAIVEQQTFTPRLRHVFEETAYWAPSLETSTNGNATFRFKLPDSLTTWKLRALASTTDGRVQTIEQSFLTFQPFFVDLDAPSVLTVGDEIALPANLRNYTKTPLRMPATFNDEPWATLLTSRTMQVSVPAEGTAAANFRFRASALAESGSMRITAANSTIGDAIEKPVRVHPDGEPRSLASTALLRGKQASLALDLPQTAIADSLHGQLRLYPNLASHIVQSINSLVEAPHGCGEQTISSSYPNLLLLELVKATGLSSPFSARARQYLQQGVERLRDYFDTSGGLTYWGSDDHHPDPALTAYGIEFLSEASPYLSSPDAIDPLVPNARSWLLNTQQADGSWKSYYGVATVRSTLYIALILAQSPNFSAAASSNDRTHQAVDRALAWAHSSVASAHDPYANALLLQIARLKHETQPAMDATAELLGSLQNDRSGKHWGSAFVSPFYSWGQAGNLETTALAIHALDSPDLPDAQRKTLDQAIVYLLQEKDSSGIWYSGQTTLRVLKALMPFATAQLKASKTSTPPLRVSINGTPLTEADATQLKADEKLLDAPRILDVSHYLKSGHNEVTLQEESDSDLATAQLSTSFYVAWGPQTVTTQTGGSYGLDFTYHCADEGAVNTAISCDVHTRRFGSNGYGMLLAEVGLPPGADVDRESLQHLLNTGAIGRYELQPDRIVFYVWSTRAEGDSFSFRFTPRFAIHAKAAPATLYDYYNPDERVVLPPQTFTIRP